MSISLAGKAKRVHDEEARRSGKIKSSNNSDKYQDVSEDKKSSAAENNMSL